LQNHVSNNSVKETIISRSFYSESIKTLTFCFILAGIIKTFENLEGGWQCKD